MDGILSRISGSSTVHKVIDERLSAMRKDQRMNEVRTSSLIYNLTITQFDLNNASSAGVIGNSVVASAIACIQKHLTDKLSADDIAANAGDSTGYVLRLFSKKPAFRPVSSSCESVWNRPRRCTRLPDFLCRSPLPVHSSVAKSCYTFDA